MGIALEIGSGINPQPGYIHCDRYYDRSQRGLLDFICDANCLPIPSNSCSSILMFGVFEHFGIYEIQEVMLEICRVLEPAGTFRFDVPDFDWFVERYLRPELLTGERDEDWVLKAIFGGQDKPGMFHRWGWGERRMREFLLKPNWNFSEVKLVGRQWRDAEKNHLVWDCIK